MKRESLSKRAQMQIVFVARVLNNTPIFHQIHRSDTTSWMDVVTLLLIFV